MTIIQFWPFVLMFEWISWQRTEILHYLPTTMRGIEIHTILSIKLDCIHSYTCNASNNSIWLQAPCSIPVHIDKNVKLSISSGLITCYPSSGNNRFSLISSDEAKGAKVYNVTLCKLLLAQGKIKMLVKV